MDSLDLQVLQQARDWRAAGHAAWLVTVIETWGSAPRPPGALLAMRDDGLVVGSVSGGCVEDDLIDRVRHGERVAKPALISYGVTKEEAARQGRDMRIAVAGFMQETNSFVPFTTTVKTFEEQYFHRGDELLTAFGSARLEIPAALDVLKEAGATPVPLRAKAAMPAASSLTQCACHTSSPSQPTLSAYSVGVMPKRARL